MTKKIAIFGSNGFLANNLSFYLKKTKNNFYLVGNKNADLICDYSKINNIVKLINKNKFDYIINCIGYTNIDNVNKENDLCFYLNVSITQNIVEAIKLSNTKPYLIHFSTDHLYNRKGLSKENEVEFINYYSTSKFYSEYFANSINSTILRCNFFGNSKHKTKKSFSDWIINNLKNNNKINSFKDIYFNPISFITLSKILEIILKKKITGIYNLGSNNGFSKNKFIKKICSYKKLNNKLINSTYSKSFFTINRPKDMRMNVSKFEKSYKIKMPTLIEEIEKL